MLTLARRGRFNFSDLPEDLQEAIRLHDLVELTHWTLDEIAAAPAAVLDRLLLVRQADIEAMKARDD